MRRRFCFLLAISFSTIWSTGRLEAPMLFTEGGPLSKHSCALSMSNKMTEMGFAPLATNLHQAKIREEALNRQQLSTIYLLSQI